jgi:aminopeptidase N
VNDTSEVRTIQTSQLQLQSNMIKRDSKPTSTEMKRQYSDPLPYVATRTIARPTFSSILLLLALALLAWNARFPSSYHSEQTKTLQLSSDVVVPLTYELEIVSHMPNLQFEGSVVIDVSIISRTSSIVLNAKNLSISSASIDSAELTITNQDDLLILHPASPIEAGLAKLKLLWNSVMFDAQSHSFFRSMDDKGNYVAATNFEPFRARMAFPCFDQPSFKTPFKVSIVHPSEFTAHSNQQLKSRELVKAGTTRTTFKDTINLPTYLIAWALESNLTTLKRKSASGVELGILHNQGSPEYAEFSLDVAVKTVDFLEAKLGVVLPLPKVDFFPVPDFTAEG